MSTKESKSNLKFGLRTIGALGVFLGVQKLLFKHSGTLDFHGRWGWFDKVLYDYFGVNGSAYFNILAGLFFFYYSFFKVK